VEWRWYFGDGRTSTERNPSHVYRASGAYTVTLSVTTQDQMDVVSKKRYITVSEGMPVGGVAGFTLLAMVVGAVGAIQLRRRRQY
jgi:PKD repeat protein